jgi:transcription initiation factor TFIIIB Brf1 subunit/transcription initiation factor TFIIB
MFELDDEAAIGVANVKCPNCGKRIQLDTTPYEMDGDMECAYCGWVTGAWQFDIDLGEETWGT